MEEIYKGKTRYGYEFEISKSAIDMELLDAIADCEDNSVYIGRVFERLLGKEQKKRFYDSIRDETGHVPAEKATECLTDFFDVIKNGKNY